MAATALPITFSHTTSKGRKHSPIPTFYQRKKNFFLEALCQTSPYISLVWNWVSCYPKHKHWEENEVTMTDIKQVSVNFFWKGPANKYWVSRKSLFGFSKYLKKEERDNGKLQRALSPSRRKPNNYNSGKVWSKGVWVVWHLREGHE